MERVQKFIYFFFLKIGIRVPQKKIPQKKI